jgi:SAM-dependent methyltransferase
VPVLVSDPFAYCRTYRDAILAAMAENGVADREAVAVVEAFAGDAHGPTESFGDDWTSHEAKGVDAPRPVKGAGAAALAKVMQVARDDGPARWLERKMGKAKVALEIGCGAGERSEVLASRVERLLVADLSLRAVFLARARASRQTAEVMGVVMDAEALPLKKRSLDLLVAEHVVDLLDAPADFFAQARAVLAKQGRLLVTTPDPALGSDEDDMVERLAVEAKLRVKERRDGLPWLRINSSRFVEVYLVQALELLAAS